MNHPNPDHEPDAPRGPPYLAPWERAFDKVASPFEEFIHNQTSGGIVLMLATVLALAIANSPLGGAYERMLAMPFSVGVGEWMLSKTLHHWVNDGLMALFFFLVGLEIKREVLVGELASPRQATLPIFAAIGGMIVPAGVYWLINPDGPAALGWGIPMATDIAFAVGVLVLLGDRVPKTLMMFLVALAIVDDLGAVLVIALFYTDKIAYDALLFASVVFAVLLAFNLAGVRRTGPYFVVGLILWLAMLKSGVHATIAGVLIAIAIPARAKFDPERFSRRMRRLLDRFDASYRPGVGILRNDEQYAVARTLKNAVDKVETPLQRLEHGLHVPVALFVIPVFALFNAGINIEGQALGAVLQDPVTLGVMLGLVVGKVLGIVGASWLAIKLNIASLPSGAHFIQLVGVGFIGGIGFTMSIFIAELAFVACRTNY